MVRILVFKYPHSRCVEEAMRLSCGIGGECINKYTTCWPITFEWIWISDRILMVVLAHNQKSLWPYYKNKTLSEFWRHVNIPEQAFTNNPLATLSEGNIQLAIYLTCDVSKSQQYYVVIKLHIIKNCFLSKNAFFI